MSKIVGTIANKQSIEGNINTAITPDITIGTTTTLEPGQQATVELDETSTRRKPVINFSIPRGEQGIQGEKGEKGETGEKGDPGDVSLNQIATERTTEVSEGLTITDSAEVKGKLDIKNGKSIQEGTPTPDTPIDIRNVGDNINLYDGEDLKVAQGNSSFQISLKEDTNYNLSFKKSRINGVTISNEVVYDIQVIRFYNSNGDLLSQINGKLYKLSSVSTIEISIPFTTPSETSYATFQLGNNNGDNNVNTLISEIKLEQSTKATSYSKYGCGSVGFKAQNKNICDNSKVTSIDIRGNGTNRIGIDLGVLSVGTYYVSRKDKNKTAALYITQVINGEYKDYETYGVEFAFTITEPCRCIIRSTDNLLTAWNSGVGELQIEKGEKTSYVEHQEQTVIFPFTEGQRLYKEGYLTNNGIHNNRKTIVLTGNETAWTTRLAGEIRLFEITLPNYGYGNTSNNYSCFSHFTNNLDLTQKYTARVMDNILAIHYDDVSTVEEWKSYLAEQYANGTPVTIEYKLITETITPYTPEQEEAYYQLQHLLMYEGYTTIECIDEIKPDIQATYLYNNEINKSYGKKIDTLEERIRQLEKALMK